MESSRSNWIKIPLLSCCRAGGIITHVRRRDRLDAERDARARPFNDERLRRCFRDSGDVNAQQHAQMPDKARPRQEWSPQSLP